MNNKQVGWLLGGICFTGLTVVCWYGQLHEFAIGAAIIALLMLVEAGVKDEY